MESEYLAADFHCASSRATIVKKLHRKMESENIKIDTEKIETQRVRENHFDEFSGVDNELNQRVTRSCHDIRQFGSTTIPADRLVALSGVPRCGLNSCGLQTLTF